MNLLRLWLLTMIVFLAAGLALTGCGEKIAIPQPVGLFSGSSYRVIEEFDDLGGPRQLAIANNTLLVLTTDALTKRDQSYGAIYTVEALANPTALCVDKEGEIVFVFEQDAHRVSWYQTTDLELLGSTEVPEVLEGVAMVTCPVGIEQHPGARTFLYISDPESLVIHRYAFDEYGGLSPFGILARAGALGVRSVLQPSGLARDSQDSLLVCDQDTSRNWVIRFVSEPDVTDVTADPDDLDPLRGRAALFGNATECSPHPASDYVLGAAPGCGETGWAGGTSSEPGEFAEPTGVAVDGSGRIFVADTANNRIQVFLETGDYELIFGNPEETPFPISLGVVDVVSDPTNNLINYAGYVFVIPWDGNKVVKYISTDQENDLILPPPPPQ